MMQLINQYAKYIDPSFGTYEYCYLIKQVDGFYSHCSPFCYEWLKMINKTEWVTEMNTYKFPENWFNYKLLNDYQPCPSSDMRKLAEFPIFETDKECFYFITYFLELYNKRRKQPWNKSIIECLETSIKLTKEHLNDDVISRLTMFVLKDIEEKEQVEQLRLLFSSIIKPYIKEYNSLGGE